MQEKPEKPPQQNPAEIAGEAFRQLAVRRIAPTPDAYREIHGEIAGYTVEPTPEKILADFAGTLMNPMDDLEEIGKVLQDAATARYWPDYSRGLTQLVMHYQRQLSARSVAAPASGSATQSLPSLLEDRQPRLIRDMLTRTLTLAVASLLQGAPELAEEAAALGRSIKAAESEQSLNDASVRLKQLSFRIELKSGDMAEQHELLLRLFKQPLENVTSLLDVDAWIHGQISDIALCEVRRSLKEVIYKQDTLKTQPGRNKNHCKEHDDHLH